MVKFTKNYTLGQRFNFGKFFYCFTGSYFLKLSKFLQYRIQILRLISFLKLTSEFLEYILKMEIPRYKLNRNLTEVSEG
jgi:hypothetical protein